MGTSYSMLSLFLARQPGNEVVMDFEAVEQFAGPLPTFARHRKAWWGNDQTHEQAREWREAGWEVVTVDLQRELIRFGRTAKTGR